MPSTVTPKRHARRALVGLVVVILAGIALNFVGVLAAPGSTFAVKAESLLPKLGLDLEGGTQIILHATQTNGRGATTDQLQQSVTIIRQRAAAGGSPDAQISIASGGNIVVSLPGTPSQATINSVREAARMDFRPCCSTSAAATVLRRVERRAVHAARVAREHAERQADERQRPRPGHAVPAEPLRQLQLRREQRARRRPTRRSRSSPARTTTRRSTCSAPSRCPAPTSPTRPPASRRRARARRPASGSSTSTFNGKGTTEFATISQRLVALTGAQNQFAILLDGKVISAPTMNAAITNGKAQISGIVHRDEREAARVAAEVRRAARELRRAEPGARSRRRSARRS